MTKNYITGDGSSMYDRVLDEQEQAAYAEAAQRLADQIDAEFLAKMLEESKHQKTNG